MDNPLRAKNHERPTGLNRLKQMVKANPLIIVGFVFTGGVLARCYYAKGKELQRLLILRPLGQVFTISMLMYSVYKIEPEAFEKGFFRSEK
uniref:HIG1 domain-containing protein n=1 Tax=Trichobilharzia regenti TaxID=157069 RepID=A0AA85KFD4_TRIRE|nr:unnamed protein product [Trichobilharzia regenti]